MSYQTSLANMINNDDTLTEDQKASLWRLLMKGTRQKTREKFQRRLNLPLSLWPNYGIFNRVHLENDGEFSYCAGQEYTGEIALVRKLIIEG